MSDSPSTSLVHVDSKAVETLIKEASRGVAGLFLPRRIVKIARAEADASVIRAQAEIQVEDLKRRAEYRRREEDLIQQLNLEQIAARAQLLLTDGATTDNVDDDWLANLRDKAHLVSNEQMQTLWASVLAGEVNEPGTFSRRTVNAIADLDRQDCETFTSLCRFCWWMGDESVPLIFDSVTDEIYTDHGVTFDSVKHLDSIGLISFQGPGGSFTRTVEITNEVMYFDERFLLEVPAGPDYTLSVGRVMLTAIGRELARISGVESLPAFRDYMLRRWEQLLKPA